MPDSEKTAPSSHSSISWPQSTSFNGSTNICHAYHPRLAVDLVAPYSFLSHGLSERRVRDAGQIGHLAEWAQPRLILIWRAFDLALKLLVAALHRVAWRVAEPIGQRAERQAPIRRLLLPRLIDFRASIEGDRSTEFAAVHFSLPFLSFYGHMPGDY